MAKALLILPHLPQRMGAPYLGQQYIAASLVAAGHEVKCLDLAAVRFTGTDDDAVREVERFAPDLVGMTLFTLNARRGYLLAQRLRGATRLLVAGGPHPTVLPDEPLANGFDVSVVGEGERAIVAIAALLDQSEQNGHSGQGDAAVAAGLREITGVRTASGHGPPGGVLDDLDALPYPLTSYPAFDASAYSADGMVVPGGMMTSRGCPARCTFCANYVTGRAYRFRSTEDIIGEMVALADHHGVMHFPFWDDAFTALRPRLNALCDAIDAEPALAGCTWTCITPGNMVRPHDLERMRAAGCVAINFGIESGDYNILKAIQKGQRPEHVRAAVRAAKQAGMVTIVNFMFGFPDEGVDELGRTLALMQELAPDTDYFNNRGVLMPFPGTAIYDANHERYGFSGWWLDPARIPDELDTRGLSTDAASALLETDPTLEQDFFRYSEPVREMIARCVRFKAQHNHRTIARLQQQYATTAA